MASSENIAGYVVGGVGGKLGYEELIGKPRKAAQDAANKQLAAQAKAEQDAKDLQAQNQAALDRDNAKNKTEAAALSSGGRRSTILTGPGGVGASSAGSKTLLGL